MPPETAFKHRTAQAAAAVLDLLRERWPYIRPPARAEALGVMAACRAQLRQADSDIARGNALYSFLQALDALPLAAMLGEAVRSKARSGIVRVIVTVSAAEAERFDAMLAEFADLPIEEPPEIAWAVVEAGTDGMAVPKTPLVSLVASPFSYREPEATLVQAIERLQRGWRSLPPNVQAQLAPLVQQTVSDLWYATTDAECTQAINRLLYALETTPAVLAIVGDLLQSNRNAPLRSGATAPLAAAAELARLVAGGPPQMAMIDRPEPLPIVEIEKTAASAETFVDLHTKVDFPAEVSIFDEAVPLVVQLTVALPEQTAVAKEVRVGFEDLTKPELVTVVLTAEGFAEITGDWTRLIQVYATRDSQPAVFLLQPQAAGRQRLTLNFYHKDRLAGVASFESEVKDRPPLNRHARAAVQPLIEEPAVFAPASPARLSTGAVVAVPGERAPTTTTVAATITLSNNPPEPVDLELRVTTGSSKTQLSYLLHSAKGAVGYHWTPAGSVQLDDEPRRFVEKTFDRLSRMARRGADRRSDADDRAYRDELSRIGQNLYERLFSADLKREYRRMRQLAAAGVVKSLVVTSDEPWIPWELVKPYEFDAATGEVIDDDFLCVQFRLSRWLAGRGIPDLVRVRAAQLVAPGSNLEYVRRERDYFTGELPPTVRPGPILQTKREVLTALEAAGTQVFHFACHGDFAYDNPDESVLVLQDREEFAPSEVIGAVRAGVTRSQPLIFLNACHSGQIGFALTGLGGWAERFVHAGASAFIGTLWEVNDALAAEFAVDFYRRLWQGESLGHAFHAARLHIRDQDDANPTWLAYTLYADPNGRAVTGDR